MEHRDIEYVHKGVAVGGGNEIHVKLCSRCFQISIFIQSP